MHLVVCIKQVPVTAQTRVHLARTRSLRRQMLRTSTLSGDTFIHFTPET